MNAMLTVLVTCQALLGQLRAAAQDDERGEGGVSYLLVVLGAIVIVGLVIAAVTAYVTRETGKLG